MFKNENWKFYIYFQDHEPPHIYVRGKKAEARFNIQTLECMKNFGFNARAILKIRIALALRREKLLERWNEYKKETD
ncbi:MAG: DUF4160 domain-containing protein [Xanthomonadaceae bacterium]|nr:DUF4160 domain-containing protein [Xanthomonadaceae bacterium]